MFQDKGISINALLFKMEKKKKKYLWHCSCSFSLLLSLIRLLIWVSQQAFNRESQNQGVDPQSLDVVKGSTEVTEAVTIYTS